MEKFWNSISLSGTSTFHSLSVNRNIILCNRLSLMVFILIIGIGLLQTFYFEFGIISIISLICASLFILPVLINLAGYNQVSRLLFCLMLPVLTLSVSIFAKRLYPNHIGESFYYDYRYILLGVSVIPPILFGLNEIKLLLISTCFILIAFLLFDPVHNYFQVGFYQTGHQMPSYGFSRILAIIIFLLITCCTIVLKSIYDGFEKQNEELIEELTLQTDRLNDSQEKLQEANSIIQKQKELLQIQNQNLESQLQSKTKDLMDSNTELIKHNTELRQFSYTVSHNLRGPVASIMGLLQIIDPQTLAGENATIIKHSISSVNKLDATIRDLSKIIDIRNDIFRVRQQVSLTAELQNTIRTFEKEIKANNVTLISSFEQAPLIYSVQPMIASILYNLVGNSIKYRSSERALQIEITSRQEDHYFTLTVKDNGLGIDTLQHKDNLFMMYKRFHQQTEGKGLGLYLVKLQAEALGGSVEVYSEVNRFTQFTVKLKKPENVERQYLYQEPHAQIFFDARLNSMGVVWNGPLTSHQYRTVFNKCLDFIKVYHTPNYISDLTRQGLIQPEDQQWVFNEIFPQAVKYGLKRIGAVRPPDGNITSSDYISGLKDTLKHLDITFATFLSPDEVSRWMEQQNEKDSLTR